ncbi:hypothetical protein [Acetobacter persici]|uniref:hypothetical protein n=1 Tax=Acetobacter persici TaxID=1076596 RepID=UPI00211ACB1C|nr:hypothetical protein [Acetobacter persici]
MMKPAQEYCPQQLLQYPLQAEQALSKRKPTRRIEGAVYGGTSPCLQGWIFCSRLVLPHLNASKGENEKRFSLRHGASACPLPP